MAFFSCFHFAFLFYLCGDPNHHSLDPYRAVSGAGRSYLSSHPAPSCPNLTHFTGPRGLTFSGHYIVLISVCVLNPQLGKELPDGWAEVLFPSVLSITWCLVKKKGWKNGRMDGREGEKKDD